MTIWSLTFKFQPSVVRPLIKLNSVISLQTPFYQIIFVWNFNRVTKKKTVNSLSTAAAINFVWLKYSEAIDIE